MILCRKNIPAIAELGKIPVPPVAIFGLPEKVLQFGTGVLLRGLPDYFINKANVSGIFNGRIVVVKSTGSGEHRLFHVQDNLYTTISRGLENRVQVDQMEINSSISRVLSAKEDWHKIMACAEDPAMQVIISNTTETGIVLDPSDNIFAGPPTSFPGKLLAFLHRRFISSGGEHAAGFVIVPTELIIDNAHQLHQILLQLADSNRLEASFKNWITRANLFCNSLVDRIVPGKLTSYDRDAYVGRTGFVDELSIMVESYRLWAIESPSDNVKKVLSFAEADAGVVIAPDITMFRELKLRLLNGTHSFCCGLALLSGYTTVRDAMQVEAFKCLVRNLMLKETSPLIETEEISSEMAEQFALTVIDRFANPYIAHEWISISLQYTSKIKQRCIPLILSYYQKYAVAPRLMSLGMAGYLLFMNGYQTADGACETKINGDVFTIRDDKAWLLMSKWNSSDLSDAMHSILADESLWGHDLTALPGFAVGIVETIESISQIGALATIKKTLDKLQYC